MKNDNLYTFKDRPNFLLRFGSRVFLPFVVLLIISLPLYKHAGIFILIIAWLAGIITGYIQFNLTSSFVFELKLSVDDIIIYYNKFDKIKILSIPLKSIDLKVEKYSQGSGINYKLVFYQDRKPKLTQYDISGWNEIEFDRLILWCKYLKERTSKQST